MLDIGPILDSTHVVASANFVPPPLQLYYASRVSLSGTHIEPFCALPERVNKVLLLLENRNSNRLLVECLRYRLNCDESESSTCSTCTCGHFRDYTQLAVHLRKHSQYE